MRRVSPQEAYALLTDEGFVYLDVRTVPEFESGHPAGAYNVPWVEPSEHGTTRNAAFVSQVRARFAPETPLVVGCASGVRSLEAAELLAGAGFSRVVEQRAGMAGVRDPFGRLKERGWRDEGLPVSHEALPGRGHRALLERMNSAEGTR
jgi:rhodanese-related sulfurtransferase